MYTLSSHLNLKRMTWCQMRNAANKIINSPSGKLALVDSNQQSDTDITFLPREPLNMRIAMQHQRLMSYIDLRPWFLPRNGTWARCSKLVRVAHALTATAVSAHQAPCRHPPPVQIRYSRWYFPPEKQPAGRRSLHVWRVAQERESGGGRVAEWGGAWCGA